MPSSGVQVTPRFLSSHTLRWGKEHVVGLKTSEKIGNIKRRRSRRAVPANIELGPGSSQGGK